MALTDTERISRLEKQVEGLQEYAAKVIAGWLLWKARHPRLARWGERIVKK